MNLKQFGKLVRDTRLKKGKTDLLEFAEEIGYSKPHINQVENATAKPSMVLVQKLVEALGLDPTMAYALTGYQAPNLMENAEVNKQWGLRTLPLIVQELTGEAFDESDIMSSAVSTVNMPEAYLHETLPEGWEEHELFVLKISEADMEGTINVDDMVLCASGASVESGEIGVFKWQNRLIVRRYIKQGDITILKADNPNIDIICANGKQ